MCRCWFPTHLRFAVSWQLSGFLFRTGKDTVFPVKRTGNQCWDQFSVNCTDIIQWTCLLMEHNRNRAVFFQRKLLQNIFRQCSEFLCISSLYNKKFTHLIAVVKNNRILLQTGQFSQSGLDIPGHLQIIMFKLLCNFCNIIEFHHQCGYFWKCICAGHMGLGCWLPVQFSWK